MHLLFLRRRKSKKAARRENNNQPLSATENRPGDSHNQAETKWTKQRRCPQEQNKENYTICRSSWRRVESKTLWKAVMKIPERIKRKWDLKNINGKRMTIENKNRRGWKEKKLTTKGFKQNINPQILSIGFEISVSRTKQVMRKRNSTMTTKQFRKY